MRYFTFLLVGLSAFFSTSAYAQTTYNLQTAPPANTALIQLNSTWEAITGILPPGQLNSQATGDRYDLLIRSGETVIVAGTQYINGRILVLDGGRILFTGPQSNPGRLIMDAASSIFIGEGAAILSQAPGNSGNAQRLQIGEEVIDGNDLTFLNGCSKPLVLNEITLEIFNATGDCLGAAPLPVDIRSFTASPAGNGIKIQWEAEKEWDFSHYELERSANGLDFKKIYEVPGQQTEIAGVHTYTYTDLQPNAGSNYYRLKAVDTDGSSEYHGIVTVRFMTGKSYYFSNAEARSLKVWPADAREALAIQLINMQGQIMWSGTVDAETKIQGIQPGMYVLHSQGAGNSHSQKIIIK